MWLTAVLVTALWPALLVLALALDVARRRFELPTARVTVYAAWFLWVESVGIVSLFFVGAGTLFSRPARLKATYAVQRLYTAALFHAARVVLALTFEVAGDALVDRGPLLVLVRHASILDTLLPGVFLAGRHQLELRYVLKRELRFGPCLDIAGHWLPNHFVSRSRADTTHELAAVAALKEGLGEGQGVLLYPEGTRFSSSRRERALAELPPELVERARALKHLLPPRLGGVLALLEAAPACDVLLLAHDGLENFRTVGDIWAGHLIGRTVRLQYFRIHAADIPPSTRARIDLLYAQWQRVDDWVSHGA